MTIPAYYHRDGVTLFHADARDVLAQVPMPKVDVLLSDPPYGMDWRPEKMKRIANDKPREALPLLEQVLGATSEHLAEDAHAYLFCHWASWPGFYELASRTFRLKNALVWWKARGGMGDTQCSFAPDYEVVLFGMRGRRALTGKRDGAVLPNFPPVNNRDRVHPTEKPIALLKYLLSKSAPEGGTVFDPFAGSGATLAAAADLGLNAVGIELDEGYCAAAARRIEAVLDARRGALEGGRIVADDPAILGLTRPGAGYYGAGGEDRAALHGWYAVELGRGHVRIFRPAMPGELVPVGAHVHVIAGSAGLVTRSVAYQWRGALKPGLRVHAVAVADIHPLQD